MKNAEKAARNFIYITLNKYENGTTMSQIHMTDPYVYKQEGQVVFYAFNLDPFR